MTRKEECNIETIESRKNERYRMTRKEECNIETIESRKNEFNLIGLDIE
jgi:hypothetical protein